MKKYIGLVAIVLFLSSCGDNSSSSTPSTTIDNSISQNVNQTLNSKVSSLAKESKTFSDFSQKAMPTIVSYASDEYIPYFLTDYVLDSGLLETDKLLENSNISSNLEKFYEENKLNSKKNYI